MDAEQLEKIAAEFIAAAMERQLDKVADHALFLAEKYGDCELLDMLRKYLTDQHAEVRRKLQRITQEKTS